MLASGGRGSRRPREWAWSGGGRGEGGVCMARAPAPPHPCVHRRVPHGVRRWQAEGGLRRGRVSGCMTVQLMRGYVSRSAISYKSLKLRKLKAFGKSRQITPLLHPGGSSKTSLRAHDFYSDRCGRGLDAGPRPWKTVTRGTEEGENCNTGYRGG
jgi:hypothetical protein